MKTPSDLMGGLLIFGLAIAMFFVMKYFAKPRALRSSKYSTFEFVCNYIGGKWLSGLNCCNPPPGKYEVSKDFPMCIGVPFP